MTTRDVDSWAGLEGEKARLRFARVAAGRVSLSATPVIDRIHDDSSRLIVFVHGYERDRAVVAIKSVVDTLTDADFLAPTFRNRSTSNADPFEVAAELQVLIANVMREARNSAGNPYESLTLCGFSAGALLVRKAMVYGHGHLEDHPFPETGNEPAHRWQFDIDRLCLFAGMNRGWSFSGRPKHMPRLRYLVARTGTALGRLRILGRFYMEMERGARFVANLRVQWIRLSRQLGTKMPPVVQLLGSRDTVVSRDDNKDVLVARDFIFVPVPYSDHGQALGFGHLPAQDESLEAERRSRVDDSLRLTASDLAVKYQGATEELQVEQRLAGGASGRLIFLMHGIRDNSDWPRELRRMIKELDPTAHCVVSSYGHFPMAGFLVFSRRKRNVRWFMDQYTEGLAQVPGDPEIHFVGHSNGTYLLAEGLRSYETLKVDRVAFTGSVVPGDFRWDEYHRAGRVAQFRNDRASHDVIVGVFPGLFQRLGRILRTRWLRDIGDGGFRGFDYSAGEDHRENYYYQGGHSAAISAGNLLSLARYVIEGDPDPGPDTNLVDVAGWALYSSRLNWAVWILLVGALAALGALLSTLGWVAVALYVAVVVAVLLSV